MSTPIGHSLVGAALALGAVPCGGRGGRPAGGRPPGRSLALLAAAGAVAADLPDVDFLLPVAAGLPGAGFLARLVDGMRVEGVIHRTFTHSLGALGLFALAVLLLAPALARRLGGLVPPGRLGGALVLAYASHLALDYVGADPRPPYGLMVLWPWSREFQVLGVPLLPAATRGGWAELLRPSSILHNLGTAAVEVAVLGPCLLAALLRLRREGLLPPGRGSPGAAGRDPASPQLLPRGGGPPAPGGGAGR